MPETQHSKKKTGEEECIEQKSATLTNGCCCTVHPVVNTCGVYKIRQQPPKTSREMGSLFSYVRLSFPVEMIKPAP